MTVLIPHGAVKFCTLGTGVVGDRCDNYNNCKLRFVCLVLDLFHTPPQQEAQLVLLLGSPVHTSARTALPHDVALGDTFHFTLGADPATRIRYVRTSCPLDTAARAFSKQWASTVFASHTTITNSHPFALRDAVPVSEGGERVNVMLRCPAALADLEQDNELEVSAEVGEEAKEVGDGGEERRVAPRWKVRWCKRLWEGGGSRDG
ncbi:hypothetical protein EDB83DRAFT_2611177 [Lactarius deliciosus]|nr:hypothetical protein EDB83DRAFT_2611177 [Lactarius deliciosus]